MQEDVASALPDDAPLAAVQRGPLIENTHRGRFAVCGPDGTVLVSAGDPEGYVYARSSAKPFQALSLILSGAADAFGLTDNEIAIACASHSGEEVHLSAVRSLLQKAGVSEGHLQSGPHRPFYGPAADRLVRSGEPARPIHGNCSGKHAGMLAVCAHEGWRLRGYREPDHPVQRWILELVAEVCGLDEDEILLGGDGCGVPSFALPLRKLATGFARFATGEQLPANLEEACGRIREAMRSHPQLVAGTGRFDTELMEKSGLLVKGGADGVFACGSPKGWGLALKISDGASRAVRPAALSALARQEEFFGIPETSEVRDLHGEIVGETVSFR
ncbi:MAG: asparaginase [Rubrobacteraceae bacterium]